MSADPLLTAIIERYVNVLESVLLLHTSSVSTMFAHTDERGEWVEVEEGSAEQILSTEDNCAECRKPWPCPTVQAIRSESSLCGQDGGTDER